MSHQNELAAKKLRRKNLLIATILGVIAISTAIYSFMYLPAMLVGSRG